jgi:hypothetical protein
MMSNEMNKMKVSYSSTAKERGSSGSCSQRVIE